MAAAAKLCYSKCGATELMDNLTPEKTEAFLKRLTDLSHDSPLEHISFTFAIEGISRSLLAQITRHRMASYSVKSQRYVRESELCFITPEAIRLEDGLNDLYQSTMEKLWGVYGYLTRTLIFKYLETGKDNKTAEKKSIDDARYVLPNACETKMVVTMNARSLLHFFELRCCNRAQAEIRELADEMLRLVREICPHIFAKAGAPCTHGPCPEGKMSCGHPRKGENQ